MDKLNFQKTSLALKEEQGFSTNKENEIRGKVSFIEAPSNEDISQLPCLIMRIHHQSKSHDLQTSNDEVVYKYKPPGEKDSMVLDSKKLNEYADADGKEEEITYEDHEKKVSVKKSMIDNYRKKCNYYGPLRIISEKIKVKEKGLVKEAIQAKLQHVEIQATNNDGKQVDKHELNILMSQTPGIIPASDPTEKSNTDERYTVLNLGQEKYSVLKKAMSAFQKLGNVKPPFNTKIQKIFTTTGTTGQLKPVTVVTLYPRVDKVVFQPVLLNEKKQPVTTNDSKKNKTNPKLVNYYRQNYINWAHRGNVYFAEIKKIGVDFLDEVLIETPLTEDPLKLLGCSLSSSAHNLGNLDTSEDEIAESNFSIGSQEFSTDIWTYLTSLVRSDSYLIEFEFEMDDEKWLEIKRAFNMFQVDGEVIPDIVLKIVQKRKDGVYEITYYLRCIGRLIKSGTIASKQDIADLLKCLSKDKYICIGLSKEPFLRQVDQNAMLRLHMKESCILSLLPFESIHSKKCNAIIRDADSFENSKIKRGSVVVYGPSVLCQPCSNLHKKLMQMMDPSLNIFGPQEVSQRFIKQRYGSIHTININENLKRLFTLTPNEFVTNSKRKRGVSEIAENEHTIMKQLRILNSDDFKDDKPLITVNEEDFGKMIYLKKYPKTSTALRKECEVCGFKTKSMVALFTHMNDHLGPLCEECKDCNMKLSCKEALYNHVGLCVHSRKTFNCFECHNIFCSSEKLFEHMNVHRVIKPFCCYNCDATFQTMNEYKKHIKLIHQVNTVKDLNFVCSVCNSYFYTNDHLLIHKLNQNHSDDMHFRCKVCNFSCSMLSAFREHILEHTYNEREKANLAICQMCKKVFFSSYRMENHVKNKHAEITVETEKFSMEMRQKQIQTSGTQATRFEGLTCPKGYKVYSTVNALQNHEETKHSEKAESIVPLVSCKVCGRKFISESLLSSHMKLHIGNRPVFQCEECGYVYSKRAQVLEHIRNDHAEQVEKHQQMQQDHQEQHQEHEMIIETPMYETQQQAPPPQQFPGQVITVENANQIVQPQHTDSWSQLKIPQVEQSQEVGYNFSNFNSQFF